MVTLKGEHIFLRALEPDDLDFIYEIENNQDIWEMSNTITPYSKFLIKQYLENAHKDIFDFDFHNKRAGIGILIKDSVNRQKGFGADALRLLIDYCFSNLNLHQLYCNISEDNKASINLFKGCNFEKVGLKQDWNIVNGVYKNEYLFQLINN